MHRLAPLFTLFLFISLGATAEELSIAELTHIHGIGFDPSVDGGLLIATHFGLYRGRPDGKAASVSDLADDFMGFSFDPADPSRLFASGHPAQGGNLGVIQSLDGGISWEVLAAGAGGPVDFHALTVSRADPQVMYGTSGGIQTSLDGGQTWTLVGSGPERLIDLAASPNDPKILYGGTASGLMRSTDGGVSWGLAGPAGVPVSLVETTPDGAVYAFFHGVGLFRLASDGTWTERASNFGSGYLLHLAADPRNPDHLVAVTDQSAVLESLDGGTSWKAFGS